MNFECIFMYNIIMIKKLKDFTLIAYSFSTFNTKNNSIVKIEMIKKKSNQTVFYVI